MAPAILPVAALVDYELTLTMPYRLTADTGMDSLCHALEAYVSRKANPFTDSVALTAMRSIYQNIRIACAEPDNRQAREAMMLAATQGGIAFANASLSEFKSHQTIQCSSDAFTRCAASATRSGTVCDRAR